MLRRQSVILVTILLATCLCVGSCAKNRGKAVKVIGSTSVQPFAEMLAEEFNAKQQDVHVEVDGGGSSAGLKAVQDAYANIGMCSRSLKSGENFTGITIALDGIAIVVHNNNPVRGLSIEQVRNMFSGRIQNWKEVGGADRPITLVTREEGSGTREAFTNLVMGKEAQITMRSITEPSNGSVKAVVEGDESAIGYMSLGQVRGLKALGIDRVAATAENVTSGRYKLRRPFLFVVKDKPDADAQKFIDFVLSEEAQTALEREGLVRAPKTTTSTQGAGK